MGAQLVGGRFRLEDPVGIGMVPAYRARNAVDGQRVILKVIARRPGGPTTESFATEAMRFRQISESPGLVNVRDAAADANYFYLVLEPVDALSLQDRLAAYGSFRVEQALVLGRQIAQGLDLLYQNGMIHGALNSRTALMTPANTVTLIDYGLLRCIGDLLFLDSDPMYPSASYRSPQVLAGEPPLIMDDVYAAGALIYEMLTGHPPSPYYADEVAINQAVLQLLCSCLDQDRRQRFQSPADLAEEITRLLPLPQAPMVPLRIPGVTEAAHYQPAPAPAPLRTGVLRLIGGGVYSLAKGDCLIGRLDEENGIFPDIDLTDIPQGRSSTRRHARIFRSGETYYVQDLGSLNHTYVNGQVVQPQQTVALQHGDSLDIAKVSFVFELY